MPSSKRDRPAARPGDAGDSQLDALLRRRPSRTSAAATGAALSGQLDGFDSEGRLLFRPDGDPNLRVPVGIGAALSDGAVVKAARQGARALVVRTVDPSPSWMLVGLIRDRVAASARDARAGELEVQVDGETLRLTAENNIELRCGSASLTLRKDGKVVLSGTYIVSNSRGANKIRGATISLN